MVVSATQPALAHDHYEMEKAVVEAARRTWTVTVPVGCYLSIIDARRLRIDSSTDSPWSPILGSFAELRS